MKTIELQALAAVLNEAPEKPFAAGDVVIWKDHALQTHTTPSRKQPVVISRTLAEPVRTTEDDYHSHEFGRVCDVVIATPLASKNGTIGVVEFHMDSRYFRHATPEEIKAWDELPESEKFPQSQSCNCPLCTLKMALASVSASQESTPAPSPDQPVTH